MNNRDIKDGQFGWYEKWAMKRIEDKVPFGKQASCKLVYIAICSVSAKQKNSPEVECFKFDIARFASVSEKTVQRTLPMLEVLHIIGISPQDRLSNGKFEKVKIWLKQANLTAGHFGDSAETAEGLQSPIYKRNKESLKEINKESPARIRTTNLQKLIDAAIQNDVTFKHFNSVLEEFKMKNEVNPETFNTLYARFRDRLTLAPEFRKMTVWWKDKGRTSIKTSTLANWLEKALQFQKQDALRKTTQEADRSARIGAPRIQRTLDLPPEPGKPGLNLGDFDLKSLAQRKSWE